MLDQRSSPWSGSPATWLLVAVPVGAIAQYTPQTARHRTIRRFAPPRGVDAALRQASQVQSRSRSRVRPPRARPHCASSRSLGRGSAAALMAAIRRRPTSPASPRGLLESAPSAWAMAFGLGRRLGGPLQNNAADGIEIGAWQVAMKLSVVQTVRQAYPTCGIERDQPADLGAELACDLTRLGTQTGNGIGLFVQSRTIGVICRISRWPKARSPPGPGPKPPAPARLPSYPLSGPAEALGVDAIEQLDDIVDELLEQTSRRQRSPQEYVAFPQGRRARLRPRSLQLRASFAKLLHNLAIPGRSPAAGASAVRSTPWATALDPGTAKSNGGDECKSMVMSVRRMISILRGLLLRGIHLTPTILGPTGSQHCQITYRRYWPGRRSAAVPAPLPSPFARIRSARLAASLRVVVLMWPELRSVRRARESRS